MPFNIVLHHYLYFILILPLNLGWRRTNSFHFPNFVSKPAKASPHTSRFLACQVLNQVAAKTFTGSLHLYSVVEGPL